MSHNVQEIFEINFNNKTYVSSDEKLRTPCSTTLVDNSIYGKVKFLTKRKYYELTEDGPKKIKRKKMVKLLSEHEDD